MTAAMLNRETMDIHASVFCQVVDARHEAGHDGGDALP